MIDEQLLSNVIFDVRRTAESYLRVKGEPSEEQLLRDILIAFDSLLFLMKRHPEELAKIKDQVENLAALAILLAVKMNTQKKKV